MFINDPKVSSKQIANDLKEDEKIELKDQISSENLEGKWCFIENIIDYVSKADACVILTEWEAYFSLDWSSISDKMRKPAWIFDVRSVLNKDELNNHDLNFWRIGDGSDHLETNL